jgi:flagellar biosynthesis/type III secretory pathway protein FliH
VELTPDPQVARGGAVLDTPRGRLDAQIEEQLAEIGKSLRKGVVEADGAA